MQQENSQSLKRSTLSPNRHQPPLDFLPARNVNWATFAPTTPAFIEKAQQEYRPRGKRAEGIRYEAKVRSHLSARNEFFVPGPWVRFTELGYARERYCQPDGLILDFRRGQITIVEIKLKHTTKAWWWTRRLYEPVLKTLLPPTIWQYAVVEIVHWMDPHLSYPERYVVTSDLNTIAPDTFAVHVLSGRGL